MTNGKSQEKQVAFSLHETAKPKFKFGQIQIDGSKQASKVGLPKAPQKLIVGRSGKVGYTK